MSLILIRVVLLSKFIVRLLDGVGIGITFYTEHLYIGHPLPYGHFLCLECLRYCTRCSKQRGIEQESSERSIVSW